MRRRSIGRESDSSSTYEDASQGFLLGLVNRVLLRNGTLLNRVLHINSRLLVTNSSGSKPHKRLPPPLSLDTPAIGTTPSLLSGFTSFLDHDLKKTLGDNGGDGRGVGGGGGGGLEQTAEEFDAMLADTPAGIVAEVLAERRKEYSEYIARLEDERAAAVQRLRDVDERIAQAERERRAIERRILAEEEKGEEGVAEQEEEETGDEYEMDDVPRLRRLALELRGHYSGITALDHDAARGLIATGALDTQARVWDAATGACKHVVGGHGDAAVRGVQLHAGFLLTGGNDGRVRMWDLAQLDSALPPELCCQTTFAGHSGAVTCFHAHGGTLVSGSADRTVREWDLATGAERQTIDVAWEARDIGGDYGGDEGTARGDGGFVGALQVFGFAMATGTADGVLRLWDLRTAQAHRRLAGHHAQPITALGFDDRHVVSGAMDGNALLWDLRMGRVVQTLAFARPVTAVQLVAVRRAAAATAAAAAAAAEYWVAAGDGCVHRYQAASMQRMAYAATGSQAAVVSRVHCRDGETLLSGDSEGTVRVWKI